MPQYLVAIHHPDGFAASTVTAETMHEIHALSEEMIGAGVRLLAGGLQSETHAKSIRAEPTASS